VILLVSIEVFSSFQEKDNPDGAFRKCYSRRSLSTSSDHYQARSG